MEHEYGSDVSDEPDVNPVKLSLVGGALGTITGLKAKGVGGAVVGGLVGGTAGYVAGSAATDDGLGTPGGVEPIDVAIGEDDDDASDGHADGDEDDESEAHEDDEESDDEETEADADDESESTGS